MHKSDRSSTAGAVERVKDVSRAYRALSMMVRSQGMGMRGLQPLTYNQAYDRVLRIEAMNDRISTGLMAAGAGLLLAPVAEAGYMYAMANPGIVTSAGTTIETLDGYYGGSAPGNNWGSFVSGFESFTGVNIVPEWLKP